MVAAVLHQHERARVAFEPVDEMGGVSCTAMMSFTTTFSSRSAPDASLFRTSRVSRQWIALIFSSFPRTRPTFGSFANVSGSICAAQPVTTMRVSGRSRASLRMVCRACRTASAVTAQVLTTTVSASPAASASRRMISDS